MSVINEKIQETRELLAQGPTNVILQRVEAISEALLSKDLINQSANLLSTSVSYTSESISKQKNIFEIARDQSKVRTICEFSNSNNMQSFDLDTASTFQIELDFTFPTNKTFAVQILNPDSTYEINLKNTPGTYDTKYEADGSSNTFSTYAGDYYFIQSRKSGSLIGPTDYAEVNSILGPNTNLPFGEELIFNSPNLDNIKGTWNYDYIPNNIETVSYTDNTQFVSLARTLQDGYESNHYVPKIYKPLYIKRRRAIDGQPAHSLFGIAIVIVEGLKINLDWLPIGDGLGDYSAPNAATDAATIDNNSDFITLMGTFDPSNFSASSSTNDLYKSLDITSRSSSQELPSFGSDSYPNVFKLPFFPAVIGPEYLQPKSGSGGSQLTQNDIFAGRYVLVEKDRIDTSGNPDNDYRYVVDQASKFFFKNNPLITLNSDGTTSTDIIIQDNDPQAVSVSNINDIFSYGYTVSNYVTSAKFTNIQNYWKHPTNGNTATTIASAPDIASVSSTSSPVHVYLENDGSIGTDQSPIDITSDTTLEYYIITGVDVNNNVVCNKVEIVLDFTTNTQNSPTTYGLDVTTTTTSDFIGYFKFNDVNAFKNSNRFTVIDDTIDNLIAIKSDIFDPYFDNQTGDYSGGYSRYDSFLTTLNAVKSSKDVYLGYHSSIISSVSSVSYTGTTSINYSNYYSYFTDTFLSNLYSFNTQRNNRVSDLNTRIGNPAYTTALADPNYTGDGSAPTYRQVDYIPVGHTSSSGATQLSGVTPYGRKIYDMINAMIDSDVGYLLKPVKKVNNIQYSYDDIKKNRNKFEVLNGRSKQF